MINPFNRLLQGRLFTLEQKEDGRLPRAIYKPHYIKKNERSPDIHSIFDYVERINPNNKIVKVRYRKEEAAGCCEVVKVSVNFF